MKKIISLVLILSMLLSVVSVSAAQGKTTYNVNVKGKLETGGGTVKIVLKKDDSAVFMNKISVKEDGSYELGFRYSGDIAETVVSVEQNGDSITNTVISAVAESEPVTYTIDAADDAAKVTAIEEIKNYQNAGNKVIAIVYYDQDNRLLNVESALTEEFNTTDNVKTIKAFVYDKAPVDVQLEKMIDDSEKIKVLAIGNSYAVDAFAYLEEIARKEGVYLDLRIAQIGGATFKKHWDVWNATTEEGRKKYTENGEGVDISHFLEDGTVYDYITIQQSSAHSGNTDKFNEALEEVAKYIRERQPTAEILIHKTWANEKGSPVTAFVEDYNSDQAYMTKQIDKSVETACKILATVETDSGLKVSLDGKPIRYIPAGDAFVIARQSEMFDTTYTLKANWNETHKYWEPEQINEAKVVSLHRDSYHCSHTYGRYLVGLVWYRCLTGNSVLNNTYTNKRYPITEEGRKIINAAAQKAVDDTGLWN